MLQPNWKTGDTGLLVIGTGLNPGKYEIEQVIQHSPYSPTKTFDIDISSSDTPYTMTVNVHPDMVTLNQALLDFIDVFRWRNVAVLYSGTEGLCPYH